MRAVLRAPLLYFVFEVSVLNLALIVLLGRQRRVSARFLTLLPELSGSASTRRAADTAPVR